LGPVLFAIGLLAGCAGQPSGERRPARCAPPPSPARIAVAEPSEAPARALRVGTSADYPPFSEERDGRLVGFSAELMSGFAASLGRPVEWVRFRWPELVSDLEAGRFDLADGGISVRPERSIAARYSLPLTSTGAILLLRRPAWASARGLAGVRSNDRWAALRELDRPAFRVAVNQGGHLERLARAHFQRAQIEAIPGNEVRAALALGRADAVLTNTIEAPLWSAGLAGIESLGPFTRDPVAVLLGADASELAGQLDGWLLAQEQSGALGALRARYLGADAAAERTTEPVAALLAATAERLALMPMVAEAKRRQGKPVDDPAQESRVLESARVQLQEAARQATRPAPDDAAVEAFWQAQFTAAKALQRRASTASSRAYSLETDLRPALARIGTKIAWLLVRMPGGLQAADVRSRARVELADSGLHAGSIDRIADALTRASASIAEASVR
jgi:cyclohexadienyl dehydratase